MERMMVMRQGDPTDGQLMFGFTVKPSPFAAENIRLKEILWERRELIRALVAELRKKKNLISTLQEENEELRDELK